MSKELLIVAGVAGLLTLLAAVGYYLSETRRERRRWATYSDYRGGEPKSKVCPGCRNRIYSLRAIREQRCIQCGTSWGDKAT